MHGVYWVDGSGTFGNYGQFTTDEALGPSFADSAIVSNWCHLALTYTNGSWRGWTNGVSVGAGSRLPPTLIDGVWHVGRDPGQTYFKGRVDDVRLYNYCDTGMVIQIYRAGRK